MQQSTFSVGCHFLWMSPLLDARYKNPSHIHDVPKVADVDMDGQLYHKFRDQLEAKCHNSH